MEKSKIKKIGNSWYIKIPPTLRKNFQVHDNEEILVEQSGNKLEVRLITDDNSNNDAIKDLEEGIFLGIPKKIAREELYETDRY
jgi:antitoxin component of MazEF toxin-antitoxin module